MVEYYILFPNHHQGLRLYRQMKEAGVSCTIAPTPRSASNCCGISLLVQETDLAAANGVLAKSDVQTEGIVKVDRQIKNFHAI